ncbi:MAG: hypothetical protein AAF799_16790 [Myxococcota bacterium]
MKWLQRTLSVATISAIATFAVLQYQKWRQSPADATPDIEWSEASASELVLRGCDLRTTARGTECLLDPVRASDSQIVQTWLRGASIRDKGRIEVLVDDQPLPAEDLELEEIDDGLRLRIPMKGRLFGRDPSRFEIRATLRDGAHRWVTIVRERRLAPKLEDLASRIISTSDRALRGELEAQLVGLLPQLEGSDRVYAIDRLIGPTMGRNEFSRAVELADEGATAAQASGELTVGCRFLRFGVSVLLDVINDAEQADAWSTRAQHCTAATEDELDPGPGPDPDSRFKLPFVRGSLVWEQGDPVAAALAFQRSARWARRLGDPNTELRATMGQASAMGHVGRFDEAAALMATLSRSSIADDSCQGRALVDFNRANYVYAHSQAYDTADTKARELLTETDELLTSALAVFLRQECLERRRLDRSRAYLNRALARVALGRFEDARRDLEQAEPEGDEDQVAAALLHVKVELGLGQWSNAESRLALLRTKILETSQVGANLLGDTEVVAGRLAEHRADLRAAAEHYRRAEAQFESDMASSQFGLVADRQAGAQAEAAQRLVSVLLRTDEPAAALCAARVLRSRPLRLMHRAARLVREGEPTLSPLERQLEAARAHHDQSHHKPPQQRDAADRYVRDANARYEQALARATAGRAETEIGALCETLPSPQPDETSLLYHRDHLGAWWLMAWTADDLRVESLGKLSGREAPAVLTERLLEPAASMLGASTHVRVLASGALESVPFETLPWRGTPLEQSHTVRRGLDLPPGPDREGTNAGPIVFATGPRPENALRGTDNSDLERAQEFLSDLPGTLIAHRGQVDVDTFRASTTGASVLVYVGHHEPGDRLDGTHALPGLQLGPHSAADLDSILAMQPGPAHVVLVTCEGIDDDASTLSADLGLVSAYVAAGSIEVLATTESLRPDDGAAVARAISRRLSAMDSIDLPRALADVRRRGIEGHGSGVPLDLSKFRVVTR